MAVERPVKPGRHIRYFDYDRALIPNRFVADMDRKASCIDEALTLTGRTVGYPGWNLLYYATFCSMDRDGPNVIVETGSNWGFSTIMLAQALRDSGLQGHVDTVEIDAENYAKACQNVKAAGLADLVTLHLGDAKEFLAEFTQRLKGTIRFAFLDGSHRQDDVVREFELILPKLSCQSTVFFDNTWRIAEEQEADQLVNGALRIITERHGGNLINFPNTSWYTPGQAIWQKAPFAGDWGAGP